MTAWKDKPDILPINHLCWAIGRLTKDESFRVRRIVWGRLLANAEKRPGEQILQASISVEIPRYPNDR